jgi:hypothetical protein
VAAQRLPGVVGRPFALAHQPGLGIPTGTTHRLHAAGQFPAVQDGPGRTRWKRPHRVPGRLPASWLDCPGHRLDPALAAGHRDSVATVEALGCPRRLAVDQHPGGRRSCGAHCGQRPTDPRPWQAAQGVPGPALRSGWPGSDLERPSTITITEAPRRNSPPSATAIGAAVSHSSSHARRVGRSLVGERKGVRWRPRERRGVDGPESSSWAPAATIP